jgi:hypothetical protein
MNCVRSVRFIVQVNGQLTETVIPSRGLRQGDPLSPYLFLFIAESLTSVIKRATESNDLKELKICRSSPGISHLMFADDCLMFFKAEREQSKLVKEDI